MGNALNGKAVFVKKFRGKMFDRNVGKVKNVRP